VAGFVYEQDVLKFTMHGEGRVRYEASQWHYDFFIKDHLGNTRMVLTRQQQQNIYPAATLEGTASSGALNVEQGFYSVTPAQVVSKTFGSGHYNNNMGTSATPTVPNPNPQGNAAALSAKMYLLNTATQKMGLGITLKVMSGDNVNVYGRSQFASTTGTVTGSNNTVPAILGGLLGAPGNLGTQKGVGVNDINNTLNFNNITAITGSQPVGVGTNPKAGVCWILFDDQLNYVNAGFTRNTAGSGTNVLSQYNLNVPVTESGYLYVYCSNESLPAACLPAKAGQRQVL
jgi:hypothetical protein